jgi:phage baseplate assembly protein W
MPLITRTYSDIDLNFTKHPMTGDIAKKKDISAVSTAIFNLFSTSNYERLFQPEIGCSLKRMLFEPVDNSTTVLMEDIIKQTIINFEPRVKLEEVSIEPDYDNNGYKVFVTFYYLNNSEPITIRIFLERIR